MCVVRSRELNYVDYYVMVFRNVCFELEFVIRDVILVKDNSCRYEFMTYHLCHPVVLGMRPPLKPAPTPMLFSSAFFFKNYFFA